MTLFSVITWLCPTWTLSVVQDLAQGSATASVNPRNTDPMGYNFHLLQWELEGIQQPVKRIQLSLGGSNELRIIYNVERTTASAFQRVPLQLHREQNQFRLAVLKMYVGKERKILPWPCSTGRCARYKRESNTCSEGGGEEPRLEELDC